MFYFISVAVWILFALLVSSLGSQKKIGFGLTLLVSLIFSPLVGLIVALVSPRKEERDKPVKPSKEIVTLTKQAIQAYKKNEYDEAIRLTEETLKLDPFNYTTHYNLANLYSIKNDKEKAFFHLAKAVANGYKDFKKIETDSDLTWLRNQPEYDGFMKNGFQMPS